MISVTLAQIGRRFPDRRCLATVRLNRVELRDPIVVGARSFDRFGREGLAVGRPVVVVDEHVRRAHLAQLPVFQDRNPLLFDDTADHAGVGFVGDEGARALRRTGDEEHCELLAVGRPLRLRQLALYTRHAKGRLVVVDVDDIDLLLTRGWSGVRKERERLAVGRPGQAIVLMAAAVVGRENRPSLVQRRSDPAQVDRRGAVGGRDIFDPRDEPSVGRDRRLVEPAHLIEGVEDGANLSRPALRLSKGRSLGRRRRGHRGDGQRSRQSAHSCVHPITIIGIT